MDHHTSRLPLAGMCKTAMNFLKALEFELDPGTQQARRAEHHKRAVRVLRRQNAMQRPSFDAAAAALCEPQRPYDEDWTELSVMLSVITALADHFGDECKCQTAFAEVQELMVAVAQRHPATFNQAVEAACR